VPRFLVRSGLLVGCIVAVAYALGGGLGASVAFGLYLVVELQRRASSQIAEKVDVLFKTSDRTLDLAVGVRRDVEFLPIAVERIESKLSRIEARIERIEARIERVESKIASELYAPKSG
jgi:hypothetical protein